MFFSRLYWGIERYPEAPYFVLGVYLILLGHSNAAFILSHTSLFLWICLAAGITVKALLKTPRPKAYYGGFYWTLYDVPSIHTMLSWGISAFVFGLNPVWGIALLPIGIFYLLSRLALGFHSVLGVAVGAALGCLVGWLVSPAWNFSFGFAAEFCLSALFFIVPFCVSFVRRRRMKRAQF
ncbi:Uncharacterised protein [uncultured archaeon]|nr:Uncharacterised protein [uncultured archaeon]